VLWTPINVDHFLRELEEHPNQDLVSSLRLWLQEGFPLGTELEPPRSSVIHDNHVSAQLNSAVVDAWLEKEVKANRVSPGVDSCPEGVYVWPLGVIPKGDTDFRIITNFSYPKRAGRAHPDSVNGRVDKSQHPVSYMTIIEFVAGFMSLDAELGGSVDESKISVNDIKHAFRNLPVNKRYLRFSWFQWRGKFFCDLFLSFGGAANPFYFDAFAMAVNWVVDRRVVRSIGPRKAYTGHLLDDFGSATRSLLAAAVADEALVDVMTECRIPIHEGKRQRPSNDGILLGVRLDMPNARVRLPDDKIDKLLRAMGEASSKRVVPLAAMNWLTGLLNFAELWCPQVSPLTASLYRAAAVATAAGRKVVRIEREQLADLEAWSAVLRDEERRWTPMSWLFPSGQAPSQVWAGDASGRCGFGAFSVAGPGQRFFHEPWPNDEWLQGAQDISSALQEAVPLAVLAVWKLRPGEVLQYHTDSQALWGAMRKGRSPKPALNRLLRMVFLAAAKRGGNVQVVWAPRTDANQILADFLSRGDLQDFQAARPSSSRQAIPPALARRALGVL